MKILSLSLTLLATCWTGPVQAELATEYLAANNLNFTCTVLNHESQANPEAPRKDIMLLHGFPMFRGWWEPLLTYWDEMLQREDSMSVKAVACDLRGYSPGASPNDINEYDYSIFAEDTFALAEAAGFDSGFHLLGHDHGAGLAWYIAAHDTEDQLLSLTTMSVPHNDLLSDAICGDSDRIDPDQVIAVNYFNQFSLPDSATRNNASLTNFFASLGLPLEPEPFQKMLWWYNGSLTKYIALPAIVSDETVATYKAEKGPAASFFVEGARQAIPLEERPSCTPASDRLGAIEIPTLFICGTSDTSLLCNNAYVTNYPVDLLPNYEHANFQCGHDFFLEGQCDTTEESQAVMEKITSFVLLGEVHGVEEVPPSIGSVSEDEEPDDSGAASSFLSFLTMPLAVWELALLAVH